MAIDRVKQVRPGSRTTPALTSEPGVRLGEGPGSVEVSVAVPTPVEETWVALTEPDRVDRWFGRLRGPLRPGANARLDFEDGDFFALDVTEAEAPRRLHWTWRFMGCGPHIDIEIDVAPWDGGAVVTVRDTEPSRSDDEALELGDRWRDFTTRLQRHLLTGDRTRYDWRSAVDVRIGLRGVDAATAWRIAIPGAARWLPLEGGATLSAGRVLVLDDREEPAAFTLSDVELSGDESVRFCLRPAGFSRRTTCAISITDSGDDAALWIHHTGFKDLDGPQAVVRRIRERWAAAWLSAAWDARVIVEHEAARAAA